MTSLLCVDALQRERLSEGGHRGGNKSVSRLRTWATLVQRKVQSQVHRYNDLPVSVACLARRQVPTYQFQQKMANASRELKQIIGTGPPECCSPTAHGIPQTSTDLALCRWLEQHDQWHLLEQAWLSELGNGTPLLFRHKASAQVFFSIG